VQEAVVHTVLGCTLYSSSSIPVPQSISEREKNPQTDIMKAKMSQQLQTLSPQFFHFWNQPSCMSPEQILQSLW